MRTAIVSILALIAGLWAGMLVSDWRSPEGVSTASMLPGVLYKDSPVVVVTRTLPRETFVQRAAAARETITVTNTITTTVTPDPLTETITATATETKTQEKKRERD